MSKSGPKKKSKLERKYPVTVYITGLQLEQLGGLDKARKRALEELTSVAEMAQGPY
jgi:hypothetical protein